MDKEIKKSLLNFTLATTSPFAVLFLWENPLLLAIVLFAIGALMLLIERDRNSTIFYIGAGIIGGIGEVIVIYFGTWIYADLNIAGLPIWLPFLWGLAGLFMVRFKKFIDAIIRK